MTQSANTNRVTYVQLRLFIVAIAVVVLKMIKLYSLKPQKGGSSSTGGGKKSTAAQLRVTKGMTWLSSLQ